MSLHSLGPHDHACLFHHSPDEQAAVIVPFMREGVKRGEQCVYMSNPGREEWALALLNDAGSDLSNALKSGALRVTGNGHLYQPGCAFDGARAFAQVRQAVQAALNAGFTGLRVAAETPPGLGTEAAWNDFRAYEQNLNVYFQAAPLAAICQYDRNAFSSDKLHEVLRMHPLVIHKGAICRNMYYLSPEESLNPARHAQEVDRLLDVLLTIEDRYRDLVESAADIIYETDISGRFTFVNSVAERLMGYSAEEIIGRHYLEFIHPEAREEICHSLEDQFQKRVPLGYQEFPAVRKDGSLLWIGQNVRLVLFGGEPTRFEAVARDITARKLAGERQVLLNRILDVLNQSKNKLDTMAAVAGLVKDQLKFEALGIRFEEDGDYPYLITLGFPDAFVREERYLCRRQDDAKQELDANGKPLLACLCGCILRGETVAGLSTFTSGGSFWTNNASKAARDLNEIGRPLQFRYRCIHFGYESVALVPLRCGGRIVGLLQMNDTHRDSFTLELVEFIEGIAASLGVALSRMAAEDALRVKDAAIESSSGAIAFSELTGQLTYANDACVRLWGFDTKEEMLARSAESFWGTPREFNAARISLKRKGRWMGELVSRRRDGSPLHVHVSANIVANERGEPVCVMASLADLTGTRHLEAQLTRSERLVTAGKLAASVAHEINSPLQAIAVLLSTMRERFPGNQGFADDMALLQGAFSSIRATVKNLLDLSRPAKSRMDTVNVNEIVEKTASLLRAHLEENRVTLTLDLDPGIPPLLASHQELSQMLLNLINNAVEAIADAPKNGKARTEDAESQGAIRLQTREADNGIQIKVEDDGPGIAAAELDHVFDPFYTKKKRMGIGMGLFICHAIVEGHNGAIEVSNAPQGGAVFTVWFPVRKGAKLKMTANRTQR